MPKLEKYHPILTPNYTFDWLTKSRVKDVFTLTEQTQPTAQPTILSTADEINQTMRDIFHDKKLIWGITDRKTDQLIGRAGFELLDFVNHTATLTVTLLPAQRQLAILTEIYGRLVAFGRHELALTTLTVALLQADPQLTDLLTTLKFTKVTTTTFTLNA